MVKVIALYKRPADTAEFDRLYFGEHLPLARRIPNLQRMEVARTIGASDYYAMAELYFADAETAQAAMASPEGRAAGKQLMTFAKDLVSIHQAEIVER